MRMTRYAGEQTENNYAGKHSTVSPDFA